MTIRKATKQDCPQIMKLVYELAVYEKLADEITVSIEHFTESGFGQNPVWWAFVAENDGELVAIALYYIRFSTWKGQCMYLEDLLVTEKMRGKGIGKLLFDALITEAKEKKWNGIYWQVLDWNEPAINFYKKIDTVDIISGWLNAYINF